MNPYLIPWMDDDLEVFRDTVVRFIESEMLPYDARWREQHRPELGFRLLRKLEEEVVEMGFVESQAKQDGRNMIMVLAPHRGSKTAPPRKGDEDTDLLAEKTAEAPAQG